MNDKTAGGLWLDEIIWGINGVILSFMPLLGLPMSIYALLAVFKNKDKVKISFIRLFNLFTGMIGMFLSLRAGMTLVRTIINHF